MQPRDKKHAKKLMQIDAAGVVTSARVLQAAVKDGNDDMARRAAANIRRGLASITDLRAYLRRKKAGVR